MTQTATTVTSPNRLEQLAQKYGHTPKAAQQQVYQTFNAAATRNRDLESLTRISKGQGVQTETGAIHQEMAGIQLDLTSLADQYGRLNVEFGDFMRGDRLYGRGEAAKIWLYDLVGSKGKARELKLEAAGRRGNAIENLVNKMGEVLNEQYQKAVQAKAQAEALQLENIVHMKRLDHKLISTLRNSYGTGADYTHAEAEVNRLEGELKEIADVLVSYENEVQAAKAAGELDKVSTLTGEMIQVLEIKHGILDGRLATEGMVSEIRRQMLDSAEGLQSAKGAIAASKVNYQAINAWVDAMGELEIKYRHAREDLIPVFKIQGKIAAGGMQALDIRKTLLEVAKISQRLMEANVNLVTHLASETFELLQTPLYDVDKAREVEERITVYMQDLNAQKIAWAEAQKTLTQPVAAPHYARHQ